MVFENLLAQQCFKGLFVEILPGRHLCSHETVILTFTSKFLTFFIIEEGRVIGIISKMNWT